MAVRPPQQRGHIFWEESRAVLRLALPAVTTNALTMLLQLVDAAFVGRLGAAPLAAAALGSAYFNTIWYFILGVSTALDTLAAQAHGAGDSRSVRRWGFASAIVLLAISLPACALLACAEWVIANLFRQPAAIAALAGRYCKGLLCGTPALALLTGLQKYQQAQARMMPAVLVALFANLLNLAVNYCFIWSLGCGFDGSPLATSTVRITSLVLLSCFEIRHVMRSRQSRTAEARLHCAAPDAPRTLGAEIRTFLRLGVPGAFMLGIEAWSFELITVLAGQFGNKTLDANTVMMSVSSFTFIAFPFGVAAAASIRIGNLLGAQRPGRAYIAALVCIILSVSFMTICGLCIFVFRAHLASLFISNSDISKQVCRLALSIALFQVIDGFQGVASGVLRALGRQPHIAVVNLVAFWVFGIPAGCALAFGVGLGVKALWWGLSLGLAVGSGCYAVMLRRVDWPYEARLALMRATLLSTPVMLERAAPLLIR